METPSEAILPCLSRSPVKDLSGRDLLPRLVSRLSSNKASFLLPFLSFFRCCCHCATPDWRLLAGLSGRTDHSRDPQEHLRQILPLRQSVCLSSSLSLAPFASCHAASCATRLHRLALLPRCLSSFLPSFLPLFLAREFNSCPSVASRLVSPRDPLPDDV